MRVLYSFSISVQLLDTACKVLPLVVTVSGRVGSDTPIKCEYSGLRGVIVEETVLRYFVLFYFFIAHLIYIAVVFLVGLMTFSILFRQSNIF